MVAPIPPVGRTALADLYTSTAETPCEEISPKSKDLPPPYIPGTVGICLPFKVTRLNSGPRPRTATLDPSTFDLSIATPTILDKDSAKLPSGNLPISSAVIASTTPTFFLLISIAFFKLDLIPVTTTSSTAASSAFSSSSCARRLVEKGNNTKSDNKYLFTRCFPI